MSLFFERRAFCSHLCFLGGLSGNYSMTSSLAFRANIDNCKKVGCKDLWCANGSERAAACPLYETPRTMDSNRDCNMCGNCVKSCPHGSLRLEVRKPTSEFWNIRKPRLDVAFLAIVLVGVVIVQNLTMLGMYPTILEHVAMFTGTDNVNVNFTVVFAIAMVAPIAASGCRELRLASRLSGGSMLRDFTIFGYALIPLDLRRTWRTTSSTCWARASPCRARSCSGWRHAGSGSTALLNTATIEVLQYLTLGAGIAATVLRRVPDRRQDPRPHRLARADPAARADRAPAGDQHLHVLAADGAPRLTRETAAGRQAATAPPRRRARTSVPEQLPALLSLRRLWGMLARVARAPEEVP